MIELITLIFLLSGSLLVLIAGIGILRMPDVFMRASAVTKAGTLGVGLILMGFIVFYLDFDLSARSLAIVLFIAITSPVGAHMIGRAAYIIGDKLWDGTVQDDLKGKFDPEKHETKSTEDPDQV